MRVLVTGANGFVGRAVVNALLASGVELTQAVRHSPNRGQVAVGDIDQNTDWRMLLTSCDVVLHLAARAHVMHDSSLDPLTIYRSVNTQGTLKLALQAAESGVRRFVFVSSVKVNGERTLPNILFKSSDLPSPEDPYGISKCEAEEGLRQIGRETGMEIVVVRPPLVYGPGVKGNFSAMLMWLWRGFPLPLGAITENRRSLVALDNLVDLLLTCVYHPAAANETFLVSDGQDLSTTELLRSLGVAMNKPARLFPVPPSLLEAAAKLLGKSDMAQRLLGNLQVDISHTCQTLGWKPPLSVDVGLQRAVQGMDQ